MDLTERLIAHLRTILAAAFPSRTFHVGEMLPEAVTARVDVWLKKSGESYTEDICRQLDTVQYDLEVINLDIQLTRDVTAHIRDTLNAMSSYAAAWGGLAEWVEVDDQSDDYDRVNAVAEQPLNIGNIRLTFHV